LASLHFKTKKMSIIQPNKKNDSIGNINFIGQGATFTGDFTCDKDLRLDGIIEGNLTVNAKLVIGTNGRVKGTIFALQADISGSVTGNIEIKDSLTLRSSAAVQGDIITQKIIIESGSTFNGKCQMGGLKSDSIKSSSEAISVSQNK